MSQTMAETRTAEPKTQPEPVAPAPNTNDPGTSEMEPLTSADVCDLTGSLVPPGVIRLWGGDRAWSVWLCYTAFLVLLMLVPIDEFQSSTVYSAMKTTWADKVVHMCLFATLTGLSGCVFFPFCRDPSTTFDNITPDRVLLLVCVVGGLGIGLECLQPLFGRTFEWMDMVANLTAMIPGAGVFLALNELRHIVTNFGD